MYCAIIGDIVKSRTIVERSEAQVKLNNILNDVNSIFSEDIESKFIITLGDEFQGLLNTPIHLLKIIDYIKMNFEWSNIRFGVGFGEMQTEIRAQAIGSDGPAYHVARKAIENIKEEQKRNKKESVTRDILIYGQTNGNRALYTAINTAISLCNVIENEWSEKQFEVINEMEFTDQTQREIAQKLQVTQSSIQRRLVTSNYFSYRNAKETLQEIIMDVWEDQNEL
ncbi:SatD family protein [Gottschalkiaceae bacterium SANA]|nr:SatD family protein [Gottschalkiaceae bacterium SANA]